MATIRRPTREVEELVQDEYRAVVSPSGIGDASTTTVAVPTRKPTMELPEPSAPVHTPDPVAVEVWLITSGLKLDQTAGFRHFARSRKLGPRAAPEWERVYREFLARLV